MLVLTLAAVMAAPASFGIKPSAATIDAQTPIAEFSLSSLSAQTTVFEVRVSRWTQTALDDDYAPAPMIVVPAVFSIAPYETRLIRLEPRVPAQEDVEQSYRVRIVEVIPGSASPPPAARRLDAVLFVPPRSPAGEVGFAIERDGKNLVLRVGNASNHHVYLGRPRIEADGKELYRGPSLGYVLARSTRTFPLTLTGMLPPTGAELRFDDESGAPHSASLRVQP